MTDFDESGWKLKLSARILKKKFLVIISGVMTSSNDVINILTYQIVTYDVINDVIEVGSPKVNMFWKGLIKTQI